MLGEVGPTASGSVNYEDRSGQRGGEEDKIFEIELEHFVLYC
jgi:hypothetical protein